MTTIVDIILNGRDPMEWTPADDDIMRDVEQFEPEIGSGAAISEAFFALADAAAERGDDEAADAFWQAGAQAAATHPNS